MSEAIAKDPIAVKGMIRCRECGAIFHGKGDDIAPLGGRSIFPWDDAACAICDQWGHTGDCLEWYPDAELPEDMSELRWSLEKVMEELQKLEAAGRMTEKSLIDVMIEIDNKERKRIEEKYGSEKVLAYVKEHMECGYAMILGNPMVGLAIMSETGEKYLEDKKRAWWARQLEKDHPIRVEAEQKMEEWHAKFPEVDTWDAEYDPEVHIVTASMLRYSIGDYQRKETWRSFFNMMHEASMYNSRVSRFRKVIEEAADNPEAIESLI